MQPTWQEHRGPWRFEELAELPPDDRRYEVVDGALVVTPPPGQRHQEVAATLLTQLLRQCPDDWKVRYEWPLPLGTDGRVPDLVVLRADAPTRGAGPYPAGPEHVGLAVEVVSASSRKTDRFAKPGEYAEAGIPLYWRVETEPEVAVHAYRLQGDRYEEAGTVRGGGRLPVPWGDLEVDLPEL